MSVCSDSVQLNKRVYRQSPSDEAVSTASAGNTETVEITVVTEGQGYRRIMNERTECHAGDMYVFGGGVPYGYSASDEPLTVVTLSFRVKDALRGEAANKSSRDYCYGLFRNNAPISYALLNSEAMLRVTEAFDDIRSELEREEDHWQDAVCARLRLLMIYLGRYVNMADTASEEKPKEWMTVSSAVAEINERFGETDLNLESVASSLFISQSRLSRIFHKVTGEAFPDYVRGVRLRHACELLTNTELTNEEIAVRCGLKDVPTFYRIFKSSIGMTPGKYRSDQRDGSGKANARDVLELITEAVNRCKANNISEYIDEAISVGLSPAEILNDGLIRGMDSIGSRFKKNEVFVPEVLVAARAMNTALAHLKPFISENDIKTVGRVCIGT
ncbi:MAG: helix-turn-helix domain-containing protein, partial [Clostridia bacterium]|nr:helix-turn-helix domain-containing protein [Clostridia bacterium]